SSDPAPQPSTEAPSPSPPIDQASVSERAAPSRAHTASPGNVPCASTMRGGRHETQAIASPSDREPDATTEVVPGVLDVADLGQRNVELNAGRRAERQSALAKLELTRFVTEQADEEPDIIVESSLCRHTSPVVTWVVPFSRCGVTRIGVTRLTVGQAA